MQSGELFISSRDGVYQIRVSGRATFECAPGLRNLAKTLDTETFRAVKFDLSGCTWMDSTFMGILAMIGLRAKKISADAIVVNAGEQNINLLCGLGLKKLFQFTADEASSETPSEQTLNNAGAEKDKCSVHAQTVLDAHETLMDIDVANVKKFSGVVSMVKQELENKKQ